MTDKPLIPPALWQRISAFLKEGKTGKIIIDANRGRVQSVSLNEHVRDADPIVPIDVQEPPPLTNR